MGTGGNNIIRLKLFIVLLILLILNIDGIYSFTETDNKFYDSISDPNVNSLKDSNNIDINDQFSTRARQNANRGGYWLDTFSDDSKLDLGMCDHLNISNEEIKIEFQKPKRFSRDSNTVGLWHFDENSGSTTYDESGNNNDGSRSGPTWCTGKFNKALDYNGGSDNVAISNHASLNFGASESFTLEAWVKTDYFRGNIICKYIMGTSGYYQFFTTNNGLLQFKIQCSNANIIRHNSISKITDNKWHYLVGVRDTANDEFKIYIDGKFENSTTDTTTGSISTTGPLKFGKYTGGSALDFDGIIDEIRISDTARTWEEINDSYGFSRKQANLTSKHISLPSKMNWDSLILGLDKPANNYVNVTILNATDDQLVPGTPQYINNGEYDISFIDPKLYPSIKLNASFNGTGLESGVLNYWGVSWNATNIFHDTFFGGLKTTSSGKVEYVDGKAQLNKNLFEFKNDVNTAALWHFNEGIGKIAYDEVSVFNNGTLGASWDDTYLPTWTTGIFGNALSFDGSDDFCIVPSLHPAAGYTVEGWIKLNSVSDMDIWGDEGAWRGCGLQVVSNNFYTICSTGTPRRFSISYTPKPNTWYYIAQVFGTSNTNTYINGQLQHSSSFVLSKQTRMDLRFSIGIASYGGYYEGILNGIIDEIRISNTERTAAEINKTYQNVISKKISYLNSTSMAAPNGCSYDELIINKTDSQDEYINITILDDQTNNPILGFELLAETNINLSSINPIAHPSIKLMSVFHSTGLNSPILFDWSLNWTINNPPKIIDINTIPIVNRTFTAGILINLSDKEETECNLSLELEYKGPYDSNWKTDYISGHCYEIDHWLYNFTPTADVDLGLYSFRFTCEDYYLNSDMNEKINFIRVVNNEPIIWAVNTTLVNSQIYRTELMKIMVNASDIEIPENQLSIGIKYKSPKDMSWNTISNQYIDYSNGLWETNFIPSSNSDLGWYIFNISCNDSVTEVFEIINLQVLNNIPTQPDVLLTPFKPDTTDDLTALVSNADDIETTLVDLEFWYRWYKNNEYQPQFDNSSIIPKNDTLKHEVWRCVVYVYDGDDVGSPGEAEITILNSPPELVEEFDNLILYEDNPMILDGKLFTIFNDADSDKLDYSAIGHDHIEVKINQNNGSIEFLPEKNWFGTEYVTFYANDTFSVAALETVEIEVNPTNDLPQITQIGTQLITDYNRVLEFIVKQNDWLNLTVKLDDIDGDAKRGMIQIILSNIKSNNLNFNNIQNSMNFHPDNDDVGTHQINIKITDNNETPVIYISQDIKIEVINVNDPPSVRILMPKEGAEYTENDGISFSCAADDIDLSLSNSTEELSYKWTTNNTQYHELGTGPELINISTLPPGYYNITVEVSDRLNEKAYDSVALVITEVPTKDTPTSEKSTMGIFIWLSIIIIIIIIIIIVLALFLINKRKKRRTEVVIYPEQDVLHPVAAYQPSAHGMDTGVFGASAELTKPQLIQSEPMAAATTQELLGPQTQTPAATAEPQAQLPPVKPTIQPSPQVPKSGVKPDELTPQQKLKMLEDRLIRGEIDQDIYLELKAKLEMESKPYEPAPQLPPAQVQSPTLIVQPQVQKQLPPQESIPPGQAPPPETLQPSIEQSPITDTPTESIQEQPPKITPDLPTEAYQEPSLQQPPPQPTQPQPQPTQKQTYHPTQTPQTYQTKEIETLDEKKSKK